MEPLVIDSQSELACLSKAAKNGTWKGNFNYWTAGTQRECRDSWSWCSREGARMFNDDVTWERGQPDNNGSREDCIHLKLLKNAKGLPDAFVLTDRSCTDRYIFACKVKFAVMNISSLKNCVLIHRVILRGQNFAQL